MDISRARDLLLPASLQALDVEKYQPIRDAIMTMAQLRFLATMNQLAQCLGENEVYMEVGTFQGGSLVGSLLGNSARAVAVDNFAQFTDTNTQERLMHGLELFGVKDRVEFYNQDFHEFFADPMVNGYAVGLYYYDGAHDVQNTLNGLELGFPHVVKDGIIVLDDTLYPEVCIGLNQFLGNHPDEVKILCSISPNESWHPDWWNGTIMLQKLKGN
jgi:predicted O-methyltransferase YrrM